MSSRIVGKQKVSMLAIAALVASMAIAAIYFGLFSHASSSACPNESVGQCRPYDDLSPWNTEIPNYMSPSIDPNSDSYINAIKNVGEKLTSNPDIYTPAIYLVSNSTTRQSVKLLGGYQNKYDQGDNTRVGGGTDPLISNVPIDSSKIGIVPDDYDSQVVFWDPVTGDQWEFWQFRPAQHTDQNGIDANTGEKNYTSDASIQWVATNFTKYHSKTDSSGNHYYGRMTGGGGGRGAGTPYLAGSVRPWEIAQGHIDHAIAFAYKSPCCGTHSGLANQFWRYPAGKSDGASKNFLPSPPDGLPHDAPEGTRYQLNPNLTDAQLAGAPYNLSPTGIIIAHALQKYGMYVIDNSGSSKIYVENNVTANNGAGWGSTLTTNTLSGIPWTSFRVVAPPCDPTVPGCNPISPPPPTCTRVADINCDGSVNIQDVTVVLSNFGKPIAQSSDPRADTSGNGTVDIPDMTVVLSAFGS
jgi:hypothetical protein